ncbi:MAG: hypothetical protein D6765_15695, partial [Bacteroidetes bacterium]
LVLSMGAFLGYMNHLKNRELRMLTHQSTPAPALKDSWRKTIGTVRFRGETAAAPVFYLFVAGEKPVEVPLNTGVMPHQPVGIGFPLEENDEFLVEYPPENPRFSRIHFKRPSKRQLQRYRQRVAQRHAALHAGSSPDEIHCLLEAARQAKGYEGWADIFFQEAPPALNPHHNRKTFQALLKDRQFRATFQNCLDSLSH